MNIDKFKEEDGSYTDEVGIYYEDAESFIATGILGFCGCGCPDDALYYVRDCLHHVNEIKEKVWENKITFEEHQANGKKIFSSVGAEYFAYYFLDNKELTEHGSSVPGWLTQKGIEVLEDINELINRDEEIEPVPQSVETKLNDYEKRLSNGENIGPISLDFEEFMEIYEGEEYDHRECGFGKMFLESTWGKLEVVCCCQKDEFYVSNEL